METNKKVQVSAKVAELKNGLIEKGLTVIASNGELKHDAQDVEVIEEPKAKTLPEVMKLVQTKFAVLEKLEVLNQTEKNLDSFNLGKDNMRDQLQITDGEGNKFQTFNSSIIEKVIEVLKSEIADKRTRTEFELSEGL